MACSFAVYVLGLAASVAAFRTARRHISESRYAIASLCGLIGIIVAGWSFVHMPIHTAAGDFTPTDAPNWPMGVAKGIYLGRVVWVHDPDATSWDGLAEHWWDDAHTDQTVVDEMMSNAVRWLTGAVSDAEAWDRLFRHFNQTHGKGDAGYEPGETVAVKVNLNNSIHYDVETAEIDASPQMVQALLRQLMLEAGVDEASVTVYDAVRCIPNRIYDRCHLEFPWVQFMDGLGERGRRPVVWVDDVISYSNGPVDADARRTPDSVVSADYLINMAILKRHGWNAPVTLIGKNHFGSIAGPELLHGYIDPGGRLGYAPEVDLMGHEHLGGKTMLFLIDGLYGSRDLWTIGERWSSAPFFFDWPSSLFVSQDQVALDSVAVDFLRMEMFTELPNNTDNYLHEAARADDPPSGTFYDPEGDGTRLESLGVHEHWNDEILKQYTRNLGNPSGIELISSDPGANRLPTVSIVSPTPWAVFTFGMRIAITAYASDDDGHIDRVEFFDRTAGRLGQDSATPYEYVWTDVPVGTYAVTARAVDDDGATALSDSVSFTVVEGGCPTGQFLDPTTGECVDCLTDDNCDDDDLCTGDTCVDGACGHVPTECPTGQICDPETGECANCVTDDDCDDGDLCTGDTCVDGECEHTFLECPVGQSCDPDTGECVGCLTDDDCQDGDLCTGDTCVDGECEHASVECPVGQSCDPDTGDCTRDRVAPRRSGGTCGAFGLPMIGVVLGLVVLALIRPSIRGADGQ
ncbi:MAG: DUF362 domain-containing protein [Phycisphaerales bacterium]|nr:MAG: DUF362 domain-containing protein [Phycisphaerales bacterium]